MDSVFRFYVIMCYQYTICFNKISNSALIHPSFKVRVWWFLRNCIAWNTFRKVFIHSSQHHRPIHTITHSNERTFRLYKRGCLLFIWSTKYTTHNQSGTQTLSVLFDMRLPVIHFKCRTHTNELLAQNLTTQLHQTCAVEVHDIHKLC